MFSDGRPTAGHRKAQGPNRNYFGQPSDGRTPQSARTETYSFRAAVRRPDAARRKGQKVLISDGRPPPGRRKGQGPKRICSDGRPPAGRRKAQGRKRTYFGRPPAGRTPQGANAEKYVFRAAVRRPDENGSPDNLPEPRRTNVGLVNHQPNFV